MESARAEHDKIELAAESFWRTPQRAVPGRPRQRIERSEVMSGSSYQQFQASVNDAWDLGDDDIISGIAETRISRAISHTAALNVINSHRNSTKGASKSDARSEAPPARADEVRRPGAAGPLRHYPGRPRPVRLSALASREESNESKLERFQQLLNSAVLDLDELKQLSWSGIPAKARAVTWRLLAGYLPANAERRAETLQRKRADYRHLVRQYYDAEREEDTYRQIHIDIPRMSPLVALFQQPTVQVMFERVLYIWAIRHPASGYVQGINDLVTPFFMVFLQEAAPGRELDDFPLDSLRAEQRDIIEADSFWCLSKFLDSIQDNYIFAQLGIQYKFSFRWMNNLLTREIPLACSIRLWDTYLAESDGFASFQLYVCAAFLLHWRERLLLERDFQGLMLLLQNVPTHNWSDSHIGVLVAEAYRLKFAFADAPSHLAPAGRGAPGHQAPAGRGARS
ncbi:TBC1 domain family member 22B isoform X2 [Pararge aegeria]|uniref:TBC1 domain family member 22B isoform X2 n=1 Tax=Pararge aegeria TaxID=116150 RepID=UPI0019CFB066|nr:TBC1 domain family member 22B isoform X2 [Pararge aegeria]